MALLPSPLRLLRLLVRAGRVGLARALIFLSAVGAGLTHAGRPEDEELESVQRHLVAPAVRANRTMAAVKRHHPHGRVLAGLAVGLNSRPGRRRDGGLPAGLSRVRRSAGPGGPGPAWPRAGAAGWPAGSAAGAVIGGAARAAARG